MKEILRNIGPIRAGHPFRGAIVENRDGNGSVIQVKDLDLNGTIDFENLVQAEVYGRSQPGWLSRGDVLFISRGVKLVAAAIPHDVSPVVCSPHFFVIQCAENRLVPEFLAWQLNQSQSQRYFAKVSMGSDQLSVSKKDLGALSITIPSIEEQHRILELVFCIKKEKELYQKLIDNRQQQLKGVVQNIFERERNI